MTKLVRASDLKLTANDHKQIAALFGLKELDPVGGFENLIFRSTSAEGSIVRVTHTSRRSLEQVLGELEFINHLHSKDAPVIRVVPSTEGAPASTYTTDDGETVIVSSMAKAPGTHRPLTEWTVDHIETYGRSLALLHRAARDYVPSSSAHRRPPWHDPFFDPGFATAESPLRERFELLIRRGRSLPAGGTRLLIHQDAHFGNLHLTDDGQLTFFDFDDCGYGSRTHDIALCFFYPFYGAEDIRPNTLREFARPFLRGYETVLSLPSGWPEGIDTFMSLREVDLLLLVAKFPHKRPKDDRFLRRAETHLANDAPCLESPSSEWAMPE